MSASHVKRLELIFESGDSACRQTDMKTKDEEARRLKVEQTKKEMEEAFKAALQARVDQVDNNAKKVEAMRLEAKEMEAGRALAGGPYT